MSASWRVAGATGICLPSGNSDQSVRTKCHTGKTLLVATLWSPPTVECPSGFSSRKSAFRRSPHWRGLGEKHWGRCLALSSAHAPTSPTPSRAVSLFRLIRAKMSDGPDPVFHSGGAARGKAPSAGTAMGAAGRAGKDWRQDSGRICCKDCKGAWAASSKNGFSGSLRNLPTLSSSKVL